MEEWCRPTNSAPLVVNDHVIIGVSGGEYGVRGYLKSFNAKTASLNGRPSRFRLLASQEVRPGLRTTPGRAAADRLGSPAVTMPRLTRSIGVLAIQGHGHPRPMWVTIFGPSSMLALDPDTGKIKWGFQYTPNDPWDYDGMATPILVDREERRTGSQAGGRFEP